MKKWILFIFTISISSVAYLQSYNFNWHGGARDGYYWEPIVKDQYLYYIGDGNNSVDLDPSAGIDIYTDSGNDLDYVTKLDTAGNYQFSLKIKLTFGGISDVIIDANDRIIIAGSSDSAGVDLDPGPNRVGFYSNLSDASFVAIYSSSGAYINHFEYPYLSGVEAAYVSELALDSVNNLYLGGSIYGLVDLDFTAGIDTFNTNLYSKSFISKVDLNNSTYTWSRILSTPSLRNLEISNGAIYVSGEFVGSSIDLNPWGGGSIHPTASTFTSVYLGRYDLNANYLNGGAMWAANSDLYLYEMDCDDLGNVYTLCRTYDGDSAQLNITDPMAWSNNYLNGYHQFFITKYNTNLNTLWSTTIGSNASFEISDIACNNNFVMATGAAAHTLFQVTNLGAFPITQSPILTPSEKRTFISFAADGTFLYEASDSLVGTTLDEYCDGTYITLDNNNNPYIVANIYGNYDQDHGLGTALTIDIDPLIVIDYAGTIVKLNWSGYLGEEQNNSIQAIVYPNPTNDFVHISSSEIISRIDIMDLSGKILATHNLLQTNLFQLDLSTYKKGIYLANVRTSVGSKSVKIIVQ